MNTVHTRLLHLWTQAQVLIFALFMSWWLFSRGGVLEVGLEAGVWKLEARPDAAGGAGGDAALRHAASLWFQRRLATQSRTILILVETCGRLRQFPMPR
jgi:hypothetical protein